MLRRSVSSVASFLAFTFRSCRKKILGGGAALEREAFWLDALPHFESTDRIPRIIHQVSGAPLPPPLQRNIERTKAANPDWEHRFYDEAACQAFIHEHYGERILDIYLRIRPEYGAARGDLFRYLAVYAVGGVYLDIKSYLDRPIDSVIAQDDAYILAHWDNGPEGEHPGAGLHPELAGQPAGEFQQWHVIARPAHPFLRSVIAKVLANIETYRPWRQGVGRNGVLRVTGPVAYTLAILPILDRYPHRLLATPAEAGLRYSIGEGYQHMSAFPNHYSLHTTPVARIPLWAKPPAALFGFFKRRHQTAAARA